MTRIFLMNRSALMLIFFMIVCFQSSVTAATLFEDDFNDGIINPAWIANSNHSSNSFSESGGIIQITQDVTDTYASLVLPLTVNPSGSITISRRVFTHKEGINFMGGMALLNSIASPAEYCDIRICHDWHNFWDEFDTFVKYTRYDLPPRTHGGGTTSSIVSTSIPAKWDQWYDESFTYNFSTGECIYSEDGVEKFVYTALPFHFVEDGKVWLRILPYGWYTGHYEQMDYITISGDVLEFDWVEITPAAQWTPRYNHEILEFGGTLYVFGGSVSSGMTNDVWYSLDGLAWAEATPSANWPQSACASSLVYDDKMWRIGGLGCLHDIWYSSDGITWNKIPATPAWPGRVHHCSLEFEGKMWVLGGDIDPYTPDTSTGLVNDVWYSTDGSDWIEVISTADWTPRRAFSVAAFDGKLWVIGGETSSGRVNDVWWSDNGSIWNLATNCAPWTPRNNHNTVVYDNKMWVMGGYDGTLCNDVWWSDDGVSWTRVVSSNVWSPRNGKAAVFNDRMWVLGGRDENDNYLNDVWANVGKVSGKKGYEYHYDTVSRLTEINPNNGVHITYDYDPSGNRLEKRVYSDLEVSAGPATPASGGVANTISDRPMLQASLFCEAGDTVTLQSLTLSTSGTGNESTALTGAKLWLDANGDGAVDGGDTQLGSTVTIGQDNGVLTFSNLNRVLAAGTPVYLLVTYTLNGTAGTGQTFMVRLASPAGVNAVFADTGQPVVPLGSPVTGATITISTDTIPPTFGGLISAIPGSRSIDLSWDAVTDSSMPITYGIWMSMASFGGVISGEPVFQTADTTFTVPNLSNGQEYFFIVRAQDAAGNRETNTVELAAIPESILYSLTVSSGPNGTVVGGSDLPYEEGMEVTLSGIPDWGYVFTGWTGDVVSGQEASNPLSVFMDGDKTLMANFARSTGTVVVNVNTPAAPWSLTDGDGSTHTGTGALTLTEVPTGTITVEWLPLAAHRIPEPAVPQVLLSGGAVIFTGSFSPLVYFGQMLPNQHLYTGDTLFLQAFAEGGLGQLHYQWIFTPEDKSSPVPVGANTDVFIVNGVTTDNSGSYVCEVTDSTLFVNPSNTALITVRDHLVITQHPVSANVIAGKSHILSVETTGGYAPLTYQWKKEGVVLPDQFSHSLEFSSISLEDTGSYTVEISDANSDTLESEPAVLNVDSGLFMSSWTSNILMTAIIVFSVALFGRKINLISLFKPRKRFCERNKG